MPNYLHLCKKKLKMLSSGKGVEKKWAIEGFDDYFFGADKKLYRMDSRGVFKENPLKMQGYTKGYYLKGKFFSFTKLRPLLRKC